MFNKKINIVFIILVFMLSLGVVSSADTNTTDDVIASEVDEEPPSGAVDITSTDDVIPDSDLNSDEFNLSGNDIDMYYSGTANYEVFLSQNQLPINGASVIINIDGVVYNKTTDENGKISIPLNLTAGNHIVSASFANLVSYSKVKVLPIIDAKNFVKTYKSSKKFSAKFYDSNGNALKNTKVKFKIKGKTYTKKTNAKGIASIALNLKVGQYIIVSIHPNGYQVSNKVVIKHSVTTANLKKHYKSYKKFNAKFYGKNGKPLSKKYVKFKYRGTTIVKKTNSKGKVSIKIDSKPGKYKIISTNPQTGEKIKSSIEVLPTIYAKKMTAFTGQSYKYKVKLYKNEKLVKNAKVRVYVDGVKKTAKTNKNGIATIKFKLDKGNYNFKSVDLYTGYTVNKKVTVKLATIKAHNIGAIENDSSVFQIQVLKQNGKPSKYSKVQITINGESHIVKTNAKGFAHVNFKFPVGKYKVVCKDLKSGYQITCQISVVKDRMGISYTKYGVSEDGKTILAIGRPSASGELSKYGYTWYMVEFERTCPHCHGHNLYWGLFWAGDEKSNTGVFPATGNRESSSAEGAIFCADCDADYSIFGKEHANHPLYLTIISAAQRTSKEIAYILKNGNYVKI